VKPSVTPTDAEMELIPYLNPALAGVLAAICAWTDLKSMTIYNRHTYPAAVAGLVYSLATAQYHHLYGALIVFAMYLVLFLIGRGKMGGGDLKLAVAISFFLGYEAVIYGSLLAGVILLAWGFASTAARSGLRAGVLVAMGRLPGGALPYGALLGPLSVMAAILQII